MVKMFLKIRRALLLALVVVLLAIPMMQTTAAAASSDEQASSWLDKAKDKAGQALETAKEKAPEVWEQTKDKAAEAYDAAKEAAPGVIDKAKDGLSDAQDAISSWNQDQQEQFWERTNKAICGSTQDDERESGQNDATPNSDDSQLSRDTGDGIAQGSTAEDANQAAPTEKAPNVEKGDGYVIVDGERYESVKLLPYALVISLVLVGGLCLLCYLARRKRK